MSFIKDQLRNLYSTTAGKTGLINLLAAAKVPLLTFTTPEIIEASDARTEVKMRLNYRTKNHLGTMYFGALAIGAELSVALPAIDATMVEGKKANFIFKDFKAEFHKRVEGDVHFIFEQPAQIKAMIEKAIESGERQTQEFEGKAYVPSKSAEPVMTYKISISVK